MTIKTITREYSKTTEVKPRGGIGKSKWIKHSMQVTAELVPTDDYFKASDMLEKIVVDSVNYAIEQEENR